MNRRDRSAIVFVTVTCVFLFGLKLNHQFLDDYQLAYIRQTSPTLPTDVSLIGYTGYPTPSVNQQVIDLLGKNSTPIEIPLVFDNLLDVEELSTKNVDEEKCIPFFWHIYRSAGDTMKQLMGQCLGLTLASSFKYPIDNIMNQNQVRLMRFDNVKFFNVNLQTQDGIQRAKFMDIIHEVKTDLGPMVVDALISPNINAVLNTLLSENDVEKYETRVKGGMFIISRNPIEREISNFYAIKLSTRRPDVAAYGLSDWFGLPFYMGNAMVRQLTNKVDPTVEVTMEDLFVAKEILRRKCIVGLLEQKQESWNRFQQIFGTRWNLKSRGTTELCQEKLLNWGWRNRNSMVPSIIDINIGDELQTEGVDRSVYRQVATLNQLDMLLYEYTKHLFWEQSKFFYNTEEFNLVPENVTNSSEHEIIDENSEEETLPES